MIRKNYAEGGELIFILSGLPPSVQTDTLSADIFCNDM